jgi:hypothetical protein
MPSLICPPRSSKRPSKRSEYPHFKKMEGQDSIYSVRIGLGYRALGAMEGSRVVWFWMGSHADYDRKV